MKIIAFLVLLLCSSVTSFENKCFESACRLSGVFTRSPDPLEGYAIFLEKCQVSQYDIVSGDLAECFDLVGREKVKIVSLSESTLTSLPRGIFDGMSELFMITMDHGRLESIMEGAFVGVPKLKTLILSDNHLRSIPDGVFTGLGSLENLFLNGNELTELPSGIFRDLGSLRLLYLEGNKLTGLPAGTFGNLWSLVYLGWAGNPTSINDLDGIPRRFHVCNTFQFMMTLPNFSSLFRFVSGIF